MSEKNFRRALVLLWLMMMGLIISAFRPSDAQKQEAARIDEQVKTERLKRAEWCQANKQFIQDGLHFAVTRIEDGYQAGRPVTTATVSYPFWKTLNETARLGAKAAIRCHSKHENGLLRIVDANGVALD